MIVKCPTCHKPVEWSEKNPWRPFCCERCKLIDLGEWASDSYVIRGNSYAQTNESEADRLAQELFSSIPEEKPNKKCSEEK